VYKNIALHANGYRKKTSRVSGVVAVALLYRCYTQTSHLDKSTQATSKERLSQRTLYALLQKLKRTDYLPAPLCTPLFGEEQQLKNNHEEDISLRNVHIFKNFGAPPPFKMFEIVI
jgi:hypothetical protein